jgi:hypothetical protein
VLFPREHGAYGQLLFPLVTSLASGRPTVGAVLLVTASVAAFLAHESLLVALGHRGGRAAREQRREARRSLAAFGGVFALSGSAALVVTTPDVRAALWIPVVLGLLVAGAVVARLERTTLGELLVALALTSVCIPVALASQVQWSAALTTCVVFASAFAAATVSVRSVVGRGSKVAARSSGLAMALALAIPSALALAYQWGAIPIAGVYAALPMCATAFGLGARPPAPKNLRVVGWTLIAASALTSGILVLMRR